MKAVKKNKEVRKYLDDYLKRKEINNLTKKPLNGEDSRHACTERHISLGNMSHCSGVAHRPEVIKCPHPCFFLSFTVYTCFNDGSLPEFIYTDSILRSLNTIQNLIQI